LVKSALVNVAPVNVAPNIRVGQIRVHHHLAQCRRETEVIETYSSAAARKRLRRQRRQGGKHECHRDVLHQPRLAMCAYFTNTQAGFSRGSATIPTAAVVATSKGLLIFQRKSTSKLTSAIRTVSQSPMAILPSRTAAPSETTAIDNVAPLAARLCSDPLGKYATV
jgi:hypothetical protein